MPGTRPLTFSAIALALGSAVVVACSGSTSPSLSADPRCGGIAHVPAWQMVLGVHLADSLAFNDTLSVRLHQDIQPSALTGALTDPVSNDTGNAYRGWLTGVPGGTFAQHDTVINSATPDTLSASAFGYTSGSEMYLTIDLKTCTATIGGIFLTRDSLIDAGTNPGVQVDTAEIGYAVITGVPVDSMTAVNGLVNAGVKVYTVATASPDFSHLPEYIAGGLVGLYTAGGGSQVLDSATVGYIITAAATPAASARASTVGPLPAASSGRFSALVGRPVVGGLLRP